MARVHRSALVSLVSVATVTMTQAAFAQVTFTPAAELQRNPSLPSGMTFTPGARAPSEAPRPAERERERTSSNNSPPTAAVAVARNEPSAQDNPCARAQAQGAATSASPTVIASASPTVSPAATGASDARAAHVAEPLRERPVSEAPAVFPTVEPAHSEPAPREDRATSCAIVNGIEELALDEATSGREAGQHALEISLSSLGREAVALVTVGRAGTGREGLTFGQSRIVHFGAERATVSRAPGFEPGAVVALGPDSNVYVLSSPRFDVRRQRAAEDLRLTILDTHGTLRAHTRTIDGTRGMSIDSAPIAWRGGLAVVLGEATLVGPDRTFGAIRERVFTFANDGSPRVAPWLLTDAQSADAVGRFRVGLGRIAGGDALAAVFSDGRSLQVRRFVGGAPSESATRVFEGNAWAPEVSHDGASLIFREGGTDGRPVRLRVARWDGANVIDVGQGWEPLASVHRGRVLVAGALVAMDDGRRTSALFTEGAGHERPRVLVAPPGAHARLDDAVDVAMTALDDGALLAWIENVDRTHPDSPRRLAYARVRCR